MRSSDLGATAAIDSAIQIALSLQVKVGLMFRG
jgi:hypothetical protein